MQVKGLSVSKCNQDSRSRWGDDARSCNQPLRFTSPKYMCFAFLSAFDICKHLPQVRLERRAATSRNSPVFLYPPTLQHFPPTMIGLSPSLPAAAQGDNQSNQKLSRSAVVRCGSFPSLNGTWLEIGGLRTKEVGGVRGWVGDGSPAWNWVGSVHLVLNHQSVTRIGDVTRRGFVSTHQSL